MLMRVFECKPFIWKGKGDQLETREVKEGKAFSKEGSSLNPLEEHWTEPEATGPGMFIHYLP